MNRISDTRITWILAHHGHPEIPPALAAAIHWKVSLLLAARDWTTVGAITSVARVARGQYFAPIDDEWVLMFAWDYDTNRAYALELEPWPDDEGEESIA